MTPILAQLFVYVVGGVLVAIISAVVLGLIGKRLLGSWLEHPKIRRLQRTLDLGLEKLDKILEKQNESKD